MRLLDLPQFADLTTSGLTKVLRHHDSKVDLWALRASGRFEEYQNGQSWDVFGRAERVVSFVAERHGCAKFMGVWEILSKQKRGAGKGFVYQTREIAGYTDLEQRLVVRWGEGTRSWAQWLHRQGNKEIAELLPRNYVREFPGFYNFVVSYDELVRIIRHPDANREWHRMLRSVTGVYLILERVSGKQYVGSAYGPGGIWSRWSTYAKSPSGGNVLLRELMQAKPGVEKGFQFSILRVLEPNATKDEVLAQEALTKRKLGCRVFGLNSN